MRVKCGEIVVSPNPKPLAIRLFVCRDLTNIRRPKRTNKISCPWSRLVLNGKIRMRGIIIKTL